MMIVVFKILLAVMQYCLILGGQFANPHWKTFNLYEMVW